VREEKRKIEYKKEKVSKKIKFKIHIVTVPNGGFSQEDSATVFASEDCDHLKFVLASTSQTKCAMIATCGGVSIMLPQNLFLCF